MSSYLINEKSTNSTKQSGKQLIATFGNLDSKQIESFKFEKCVYLVSVGKENFEGKKLYAQLKLINTSFMHCTILLADTLQRFNIIAESSRIQLISEKDAYLLAEEEGNRWIERNEDILKKTFSNKNVDIARWTHFHSNEEIIKCYEVVQYILQCDEYKKAIESSIEEYVSFITLIPPSIIT